MQYSRSFVDHIEQTQSRTPYCVCGGTMVPVEHDGALWLECIRHDAPPEGWFSRIWKLIGHDRRLILSAEELPA